MMKNKVVLLVALLLISGGLSAQKKAKKEKKQEERSDEFNAQFNFYFFNGIKEKTLNNQDKAAESFRRCVELEPKNDAAQYELAKAYFALSDYPKAFEAVKQALAVNPDQEWYLKLLSNCYAGLNRPKESAEVYDKLLSLKPDRVDFYIEQADLYLRASAFPEALKVLEKLEAKIGPNEDVIMQKQKIYLRQGKVDKAIEEVGKLIKDNPKEVRYYLLAGETYFVNNQLEKAFPFYQKALELEPDNGFANLSMADYYRQKKDERNSFKYLKHAFEQESVDIDTKVRILYPYFSFINQDQYYKQALELSKLLTRVHPTEAKAVAMYADFLAQRKENTDSALVQYRAAVKLDRNIFAVWDQLIRLEITQKNFHLAEEQCDTALSLFPNQAVLYLYSGIVHSQLKDYKTSVEVLKNGVAMAGSNKALLTELYSSLGDAYHEVDNNEESDKSYDKALELNPEQEYVLNNYSYYLSLRGDKLDKAEKMAKKAISIDPANSSFLDTYAWVLYKAGKYEEAKIWIEKAIDAETPSATVLEHYGDILFKLGEVQLAVSNWTKARDAGGKSEMLDKKIASKKLYE